MLVTLKSVGNIDHGQNPNKPKIGASKNNSVQVNSFLEAKQKCMDFIDKNDLGGGNWSGGLIMDDNNKVIAHVSYNGRVWEGASWTKDTKEITNLNRNTI